MTCVVGLIADNGHVIFGADSLVTDETGFKISLLDKKIFIKNNILFGFCGNLHFGQLVKHRFNPPSPGRNKDVEAFIHTKFVPELQKFFIENGIVKFADDEEHELLIGIHKSIFAIGSDFSVMQSPTRFHAIGSGAQYALGSLFSTKGLKDDTKRLSIALEASSQFSMTVGKPFHFETLMAQSARKRASHPTKPKSTSAKPKKSKRQRSR